MIKCCNNCKNLLAIPKKNSYGDVQYLCLVTSYLVGGRNKDITKVKRYSPGGKELKCDWHEK